MDDETRKAFENLSLNNDRLITVVNAQLEKLLNRMNSLAHDFQITKDRLDKLEE